MLREKETQPQGKDVAPGDHINARDAALKDSKTASRTAPAATSSTTSITLSSSSSTLPTRQENKENKPQTRELPMPRVPVTVRSEDIPQFHYPLGKPLASADVDAVIQKATAEFATYEGGKAYKQQMGQLAKVRYYICLSLRSQRVMSVCMVWVSVAPFSSAHCSVAAQPRCVGLCWCGSVWHTFPLPSAVLESVVSLLLWVGVAPFSSAQCSVGKCRVFVVVGQCGTIFLCPLQCC